MYSKNNHNICCFTRLYMINRGIYDLHPLYFGFSSVIILYFFYLYCFFSNSLQEINWTYRYFLGNLLSLCIRENTKNRAFDKGRLGRLRICENSTFQGDSFGCFNIVSSDHAHLFFYMKVAKLVANYLTHSLVSLDLLTCLHTSTKTQLNSIFYSRPAWILEKLWVDNKLRRKEYFLITIIVFL